MKFIKWTVFFSVSFAISWVIIVTFAQPEFQLKASIAFLFITLPPMSMFIYIIGAFFTGLVLGLFIAAYYFFKFSTKLRKKEKELKKINKALHEQEQKSLSNTTESELEGEMGKNNSLENNRNKGSEG